MPMESESASLLSPWVHLVVVPSFTKLQQPGLRYQQLNVPVKLAIFPVEPFWLLLPVVRVGDRRILRLKGLRLGVVVSPDILKS